MEHVPDGACINALLQACGDQPHPVERWPLALQRSLWHLCILDQETQRLVGFVRATSDQALNANLWNLAAAPGEDQPKLLKALVHRSLATCDATCGMQHFHRRASPGLGCDQVARISA